MRISPEFLHFRVCAKIRDLDLYPKTMNPRRAEAVIAFRRGDAVIARYLFTYCLFDCLDFLLQLFVFSFEFFDRINKSSEDRTIR